MTLKGRLALIASLAVAAVWGAAAFLKSLDPAAFAIQITSHKVTPVAWSPALAYGFIMLEACLAILLLVGYRRRLACALSGALLLFFAGVTGWAWAHGNVEGCGCFGRLASRGPLATILEDAGLLFVAGCGYAWGPRGVPSGGSSRRLALLAPLVIALPLIGPRLPLDRIATDLYPGADVSTLAVDNLTASVREGSVLLAFLSDGCAACVAALPRLNEIAATGEGPTVIGVFAGDRERAQAWSLDHIPAFEVGDAPENVLKRYYRTLPRFALVQDGTVRVVWRHAPTETELSAGLRAG